MKIVYFKNIIGLIHRCIIPFAGIKKYGTILAVPYDMYEPIEVLYTDFGLPKRLEDDYESFSKYLRPQTIESIKHFVEILEPFDTKYSFDNIETFCHPEFAPIKLAAQEAIKYMEEDMTKHNIPFYQAKSDEIEYYICD